MSDRLIGFLVVAIIALAATATPRTLVAQARPTAPLDGSLVAVSVGVPGYGGEVAAEVVIIGVQWTRLRINRPGVDVALGIVPRLLFEAVAAIGTRAGVGLPIAVGRSVVLIPSAGLSLVAGYGGGIGGGAAGFNGGIAAVVLGSRTIGLRTGITLHRFMDLGGTVWLFEIGPAFIRQRAPR